MPLDMKAIVRSEAGLDQWECMLDSFFTHMASVSPPHAQKLLELVGSRANADTINGQFDAFISSTSDLSPGQRDGFMHMVLIAAHCGLSRVMLSQARRFMEISAENPLPGTNGGGSDDAA